MAKKFFSSKSEAEKPEVKEPEKPRDIPVSDYDKMMNILKAHGMESNIPMNSEYWGLRDKFMR